MRVAEPFSSGALALGGMETWAAGCTGRSRPMSAATNGLITPPATSGRGDSRPFRSGGRTPFGGSAVHRAESVAGWSGGASRGVVLVQPGSGRWRPSGASARSRSIPRGQGWVEAVNAPMFGAESGTRSRKRDRSDIVKLGGPAAGRAIFTRARHFDFGPPFAGDPWDDRPTLGPNVARFPSAIPAGQRGGLVARCGEMLPVPARCRFD